MGHSADDFFRDIEHSTKEGKTLPAWHGELYLEVRLGAFIVVFSSDVYTLYSSTAERTLRMVSRFLALTRCLPNFWSRVDQEGQQEVGNFASRYRGVSCSCTFHTFFLTYFV